MTQPPTNDQIAERLREVADLLTLQEASPYRVAAYRAAAETVAALPEPVAVLVARGGMASLVELPTIDRALGAVILELVQTGRLALLDRLHGTLDPETLFATLPGVGRKLARTIHETLHVDTLEALEVAAHDGRLGEVPGLGPRKLKAIVATLDERLGGRAHGAGSVATEPPVAMLLDVDAEYRGRAQAGELRLIAPRRNNPEGERWLPILHTQRDAWHFTALFSNTARAHELDRTHDWVVVYFADGDHHERQRTVVTETHGTLTGKRMVRGREADCARYYAERSSATREDHGRDP